MNAPTPTRPSLSILLLGAFFVFAGVMHFAKPAMYARIMPPWLPAPMALVFISGVAEVLGGVGLLVPGTRVAAGLGLIALLVAVFPANIQMLINAYSHGGSGMWKLGLIARLPIQPLMIWWVYRAAIRSGS